MGRVARDGNHPVPIPQEPAKLPLIKLVLGALRTRGSKASGAGRPKDPMTRAHERGWPGTDASGFYEYKCARGELQRFRGR